MPLLREELNNLLAALHELVSVSPDRVRLHVASKSVEYYRYGTVAPGNVVPYSVRKADLGRVARVPQTLRYFDLLLRGLPGERGLNSGHDCFSGVLMVEEKVV